MRISREKAKFKNIRIKTEVIFLVFAQDSQSFFSPSIKAAVVAHSSH